MFDTNLYEGFTHEERAMAAAALRGSDKGRRPNQRPLLGVGMREL